VGNVNAHAKKRGRRKNRRLLWPRFVKVASAAAASVGTGARPGREDDGEDGEDGERVAFAVGCAGKVRKEEDKFQ